MTDTPLHEMRFPISVRATTNVNSAEPEFIMAWLLHKAALAGKRDAINRGRFLDAAKKIASIYPYMSMAERVKKEEL